MDNTLEFLKSKYGHKMNGQNPITIEDFSRWEQLPELIRDLGFTVGAEIGVEVGHFSERLCTRIPGLKLFGIDAWKAELHHNIHDQAEVDRRKKRAENRLFPYGVRLINKESTEAVKDFALGSLDFVFIDANHNFDYVMQDIILWTKTVHPGGLVIGHDYDETDNHGALYGIIPAVQAYVRAHNINPWFVTGVVKRPGARPTVPCWMFVKP